MTRDTACASGGTSRNPSVPSTGSVSTTRPTAAGETGLSDPTAVVEPKKWHCIEVYFDMTASEARIWLDDVERTKLHWQNNMPGAFTFPAAIRSLSFGWVEYQPPQTPWDVWIDEIAVDGQRIGCEK
jgi:hypothetical protein